MSEKNFKDYYQILGIDPAASKEEIKRSYRKLAFDFHPDRNPDKREYAEKKFKEIIEAYGVLSDDSKRRHYDWLRQSQHRQQDRYYRHGQGFSSEQVFKDMFNNGRAWDIFKDLEKEFSRHGIRFDQKFFQNLFSGGKGTLFGGIFFFGPMGYKGSTFKNHVPGQAHGPHLKTRKKKEPLWLKLGKKLFSAPKDYQEIEQDQQNDINYSLTISPEEAAKGTNVLVQVKRNGKTEKLSVKVPPGLKSGSKLRLTGKGRFRKGDDKPGDMYIKIFIQNKY